MFREGQIQKMPLNPLDLIVIFDNLPVLIISNCPPKWRKLKGIQSINLGKIKLLSHFIAHFLYSQSAIIREIEHYTVTKTTTLSKSGFIVGSKIVDSDF